MKCLKSLEIKKVAVSLAVGLATVFLCRYQLVLDVIYHTKYRWYLIFPMLICEAWGMPYAIIISIFGGCASLLPFVEQPDRGFGNLLICFFYLLLYLLCGYFGGDKKKNFVYYLSFVGYCTLYYIVFATLYIPVIQQNPVASEYIFSASPTIVRIIAITNAFSILSFCSLVKVLLELPPIRFLMGLSFLPDSENNLKVLLYVLFAVFLFLITDYFFESFYFQSRGIHTFLLINKNGTLTRIPLVISVIFMVCDALVNYSMQNLGDIKKQKEAEQKIIELNEGLEQAVEDRTVSLRNAYRDLESFSYTMTHELKTPVRELNAYLEIIDEDNAELLSKQSKEDIHSAEKVCQSTLDMIEKMMIYTRAGFMTLNMEKTDIAQIVKKCFFELQKAHPEMTMELSITELPTLYADAFLLNLAISNILSNSVKFSRGRDVVRIRVSSCEENGNITYFFSDNGVGFDSENHKDLFGLFNRAHNTSEYDGSGIGLALVKRIVNRMDGTVSIEGKSGEGCTVKMSYQRKFLGP